MEVGMDESALLRNKGWEVIMLPVATGEGYRGVERRYVRLFRTRLPRRGWGGLDVGSATLARSP